MEQEIPLKTSIEVSHIRKAGRIVAEVLSRLSDFIIPERTTMEIARRVEEMLSGHDVKSSIRGYRGFPSVVCTSVNHVAVHGVPNENSLNEGDTVTVDLTVNLNGWHADAAWSYLAGKGDPGSRRLIRAAWEATAAGIEAAKAGGRIGDIGQAVERAARRYGCSVLDRFVGHGIGREMHEEPMVLHTGTEGTGIPIVPGMVFTVEPILTLGKPDVFELPDGWSMVTHDHSRCAQFEHTLAVFGARTEVLTWNDEIGPIKSGFPPFF